MRLKTLDDLSTITEILNRLTDRLTAIRSIQMKITPSYERREAQMSSYENDKAVELAAEAIKLEENIKVAILHKERQLQEAEGMIDQLSPEKREIIIMRYVDGRSWRKILIKMNGKGYSERTVFRLHREALNKLAELGME